jgi:LytS/YehU family sensor histidine kinase
MANVAERLKVLYGDTATMTIESHGGKGTLVRLRFPILQEGSGILAALYEERSSTRR